MYLDLDDKIFDELSKISKLYFDSGLKNVCNLLSTSFATYLTSFRNRLFIIHSKTHAVVYDGENTWDLGVGIFLMNYKYPNLNPPSPTIIPAFVDEFKEENFSYYYSEEALKEARTNLAITEIKYFGDYIA